MGLQHQPETLRHTPCIEKGVGDVLDRSKHNILVPERFQALGEWLGLCGIYFGEPLEVFGEFIDG